MGFYEFKKWFFDVSAGADEYLILFFSQIKLGNRYFTTFQMHGTIKDSDHDFQKSFSCLKTTHHNANDRMMMAFDEGEVRFTNGDCRLRLDFADHLISLDYRSKSVVWPETSALYRCGKTNLDWLPLILHGKVDGTIRVKGETINYLDSSGYCDEVISGIKPWKVPISKLYWGRLHHDRVNLTYSILYNGVNTQNISRLFVDFEGNQFFIDRLTLEVLSTGHSQSMDFDYPERVIIRGQSDGVLLTLEISGHQEMVLNDFMDYRDEYGRLATWFLRRISGNPKGIKFRASVDVSVQTGDEVQKIKDSLMIDEYVEFQ
jgi:hypothetical protein